MYQTISGGVAACLMLACLSCSGPPPAAKKPIYDIDSLVNAQVRYLVASRSELAKNAGLEGQTDEARYTPDSIQWSNELDIFRQLDEVNKPTFKDAYVRSERPDANSNLTVREYKSAQDVPVPAIRFYFLREPADLRKIEADVADDNPMYSNDRKLLIEFERIDGQSIIHRYRIEGMQKVVLADTSRFVIAAEIAR